MLLVVTLIVFAQWKTDVHGAGQLAAAQEPAALTETFFDAVGEGKLEVVRKLLQENPTLIRVRDKGSTALHVAIVNKQEAMVKFLVEQKADINARDDHQQTPLHTAMTWADDTSITELLLAAKADTNIGDYKGDTPLHLARFREGAELLLSKGANPKLRNEEGSTPLHEAVLWGREDVARALFDYGAEVNGC